MAVQGVAVDAQLGVQTVQVTFVGDHQRVDLDKGQIFLFEHLGQAQEDFDELVEIFTDVMEDFDIKEEDQEFLATEILKRSHLVIS